VNAVPRTTIDDAGNLTAVDVIHQRFSTLAPSATVGEVRAWFAESANRRMAFLADDGRYAGSLTPDDVDGVEAERPASEVAHQGPTIAPDAPASAGYEVALRTDARRVPVVDGDGTLLGVLSVTDDLAGFCGTS
jgi:CBS domain-containing protein